MNASAIKPAAGDQQYFYDMVLGAELGAELKKEQAEDAEDAFVANAEQFVANAETYTDSRTVKRREQQGAKRKRVDQPGPLPLPKRTLASAQVANSPQSKLQWAAEQVIPMNKQEKAQETAALEVAKMFEDAAIKAQLGIRHFERATGARIAGMYAKKERRYAVLGVTGRYSATWSKWVELAKEMADTNYPVELGFKKDTAERIQDAYKSLDTKHKRFDQDFTERALAIATWLNKFIAVAKNNGALWVHFLEILSRHSIAHDSQIPKKRVSGRLPGGVYMC